MTGSPADEMLIDVIGMLSACGQSSASALLTAADRRPE
jgi:hypothetical protein